ncbi:restriction endonuclease subunit S [Corynebacterium pyruviciproducens]
MGDVTTHFSNPGTDSSPAKTTGRKFASLLHFADVNPLTPQFKDLEDGNEVPFMPLENVWAFGKADQSARKRWKKSDTSYTQFQDGDVLVPKVTPTVFHGRSMIADIDSEIGLATSEVHVLRCKQGVDPRWIVYNMLSGRFLDEARGTVFGVGGLQRISAQYLQSYKILAIPLEAQRRIADYLDSETSEIGTLVGELDEYIELLEKRKDKFLEQQLSQHDWKPCAVGFLGEVLLGKMVTNTPASDADELFPYLRAAHVQPGGVLDFDVTEKLMWFSPEEKERLSLHTGDVVVVEGGAGFGRSSYLKSDLDGWGFQNSINRITPDPKKARGKYISIMINRALKQGEIALTCSVATIPHFTAEKLARFRIPLIAIDEQDEFLDTVLTEFGRTDSLIKECTELKEILLKRRQVLITDVVTGKVEV